MKCEDCGNELGIGRWPWCPHGPLHQALDPGTHSSEKVIVYESAREGGKIQYPGRTDVPMPQRLVERGYVRRELNVRDIATFEKTHGVMHERRHFHRNNSPD